MRVHLGNLAAQTGASRFGEERPHMEFSKVETWHKGNMPSDFDFLLVEPKGNDEQYLLQEGEME